MLINHLEIAQQRDGTVVITVKIDPKYQKTAMDEAHEASRMIGNKKQVEMTLRPARRSRDANAYCWRLMNELAAKLRITPIEIYREAIKDVADNNYVVPIKDEAVESYIKVWAGHGLGWIAETMGECKTPGYTYIVTYYGSSLYDRAQMSRLIDIIVADCKEQGIETKTPDELEKMKGQWEAYEGKIK